MIKILFVCHGNICRSPMAEFVMKQIVRERGLQDEFFIQSAATSPRRSATLSIRLRGGRCGSTACPLITAQRCR